MGTSLGLFVFFFPPLAQAGNPTDPLQIARAGLGSRGGNFVSLSHPQPGQGGGTWTGTDREQRSPRCQSGTFLSYFPVSATVTDSRLAATPWLSGVTPGLRPPCAGLAKSWGGDEDMVDARPGRGRAAAPALCVGSGVTQEPGSGVLQRGTKRVPCWEGCAPGLVHEGQIRAGMPVGCRPLLLLHSLDPQRLETTAEPLSCL